MEDIKEIMEDIKEIWAIVWMALLLIIWGIFIVTIILYPVGVLKCNSKYSDAKYDFWGWCMVKYEWQFIPEKLYEKSFIKNINLNIKK